MVCSRLSVFPLWLHRLPACAGLFSQNITPPTYAVSCFYAIFPRSWSVVYVFQVVLPTFAIYLLLSVRENIKRTQPPSDVLGSVLYIARPLGISAPCAFIEWSLGELHCDDIDSVTENWSLFAFRVLKHLYEYCFVYSSTSHILKVILETRDFL